MLIDDYRPKLSGVTLSDTVEPDHLSLVERVKTLLMSVGWELDTAHPSYEFYATATVFFLGFPTRTATTPSLSKRTVTCSSPFLVFDGVNYSYYNPDTENPTESDTCKMMELGTNQTESANNLAAKIVRGELSGQDWAASAQIVGGVAAIVIVAEDPGARANGWQAMPDGRWGTGITSTGGGGWKLISTEKRDEDDNVVTTQYSVKITGEVANSGSQFSPPSLYVNFNIGVLDQATRHDFRLDTYGTTYTADGSVGIPVQSNTGTPPPGQYTMVANPYSFGLWDDSEDVEQSPGWRKASIFVAAPYIPTEKDFTPVTSLIILSTGLRRALSYWNAIHAVFLDDTTSMMSNAGALGGYVRVLATRSPGPSLLTPTGAVLVTNAWVMFGRNPGDVPKVIGELWDCAVVNDMVGKGTIIDGKKYERISQQDGSGGKTRSSLVFAIPSYANDGGVDGGPIEYVPATGTGDIVPSPTGDYTRLNWLTGNHPFDPYMLNMNVTINGTSVHQITRVDESYQIGFWPPFDGPIFTGVTWSIG